MLKLVKTRKELPLPQLMALYEESNRRIGAQRYSREPEPRQLQLAEEDFRQYLAQVFFSTPGAMYALWLVEGNPVSALRLEPYRDGMLLEGLETAPDHRCRGCASRLVAEVQALPGVERVYSHVDKRNHPSRIVHERCGFRVVADYAAYIDGSVDSRSVTLCWERK